MATSARALRAVLSESPTRFAAGAGADGAGAAAGGAVGLGADAAFGGAGDGVCFGGATAGGDLMVDDGGAASFAGAPVVA